MTRSRTPCERERRVVPALSLGVLLGVVAVVTPPGLLAQTDFYNLDRDHPLRVEDAFPTKRWAFEAKLTPFDLARSRAGELRYAPSLELTHGVLPGVTLSGGVHLEHIRGDTHGSLELSVLANLWVEGLRRPAVAVRVGSHLPVDGDGASHLEATGILTRTLGGPVRAHANGGLLAGHGRPEDWWLGAALDYSLPFQHTLFLVDTWTARGAEGRSEVRSGAGVRYQVSPAVGLDAGLSRSWTADRGDEWQVTAGISREFGIRAVIPRGGR